jgi:hypothetical protein
MTKRHLTRLTNLTFDTSDKARYIRTAFQNGYYNLRFGTRRKPKDASVTDPLASTRQGYRMPMHIQAIPRPCTYNYLWCKTDKCPSYKDSFPKWLDCFPSQNVNPVAQMIIPLHHLSLSSKSFVPLYRLRISHARARPLSSSARSHDEYRQRSSLVRHEAPTSHTADQRSV